MTVNSESTKPAAEEALRDASETENDLIEIQALSALLRWIGNARELVASVDFIATRDKYFRARMSELCGFSSLDWDQAETDGLERVHMMISGKARASLARLAKAREAAHG